MEYFFDINTKTKSCTKCGLVLPFDDFYNHPTGCGGRHPWCITCNLEQKRLARRKAGARELPFCDIINKIKACSHCQQVLPFDAFPGGKQGKGGVRTVCRKCYRKQAMERHILKRYGLTLEQYESMLHAQGGSCAICRNVLDMPNVDHCHRTGRVRGLLCNLCNISLGGFKDDPDMLARAIEYLKKHSA